MGNEVFYVVFVGKKPGLYTSRLEWHVQVVVFKRNVYKSYETHEEAILAWVFYEPWWRRLETPSPSPMNQLIRQPCDDKVMRTSKDHL